MTSPMIDQKMSVEIFHDGESVRVARSAARRAIDVLIVGGGGAGLAAAAQLGARAVLVDDALAFGGSLGALAPSQAAELVQRARASGAELHVQTSCLALSREPA